MVKVLNYILIKQISMHHLAAYYYYSFQFNSDLYQYRFGKRIDMTDAACGTGDVRSTKTRGLTFNIVKVSCHSNYVFVFVLLSKLARSQNCILSIQLMRPKFCSTFSHTKASLSSHIISTAYRRPTPSTPFSKMCMTQQQTTEQMSLSFASYTV